MTALDRALYERELQLAGASVSAEPFSHSKTSNWVAKNGGLPHFIQHMAHDIMESDPAKTESSVIAIAISQCKKLAAKGNAKAAAAIAEWEKLKAKNAAKRGINASALTDEQHAELLLAAEPEVGPLPGETPLDLAGYTLALSQARLDLAVAFDEAKHPRLHGRFTKKVGDVVHVVHGQSIVKGKVTKVIPGEGRFKGTNRYEVQHGDAKSTHGEREMGLAPPPKSVGGQGFTGKTLVDGEFRTWEDLHKELHGKNVGKDEQPAGTGGGDYGDAEASADERGARTSGENDLREGRAAMARLRGGDARVGSRGGAAARPENEIARLQKRLAEMPQGNANRTPEQRAEAERARARIRELRKGMGHAG